MTQSNSGYLENVPDWLYENDLANQETLDKNDCIRELLHESFVVRNLMRRTDVHGSDLTELAEYNAKLENITQTLIDFTKDEVHPSWVRSWKARRPKYWSKVLTARPNAAEKDTEMAPNYDNVTLIQLEHDACVMVAGYFKNFKGEVYGGYDDHATDKKKIYHWKCEKHIAAGMRAGDGMVVNSEKGEGFAYFLRIADDFEPLPNINYSWVITSVPAPELDRLRSIDRNARKRIALGEALRQATQAVNIEDQKKMLPSYSRSENKTPSHEPLSVPIQEFDEDEVPF